MTAVDLGALAQKKNVCTVENGCTYTLVPAAKPHETLEDCVETAVGYAEQIAASAVALEQDAVLAQALTTRVREQHDQVSTLISANKRLQDDLGRTEEQVRTLKRIIRDKAQEGSNAEGEAATGT